MYVWTKTEARGKITHDLLRTEVSEPFDSMRKKLFSRGVWEGEPHHTRCDGSKMVVTSRRVPQKDPGGKAVGMLEINRDITKRKREEESMRRLSGRLLQLQEEERWRIARDLHGSMEETLAAIIMHITALSARASAMEMDGPLQT
jgi:signal transduction histidine kinase